MKSIILLFIAATLIPTVSALPAQTTRSDATDGPTPVIEKLEEIVSIREQILAGKKVLDETGRVTTAELIDAQVTVVESKIKLAEAKGRGDLIDEYLKRMVSLAERKLASLEAHDRAGVEGSSGDVANARIDLLEVEIRLLRLQK